MWDVSLLNVLNVNCPLLCICFHACTHIYIICTKLHSVCADINMILLLHPRFMYKFAAHKFPKSPWWKPWRLWDFMGSKFPWFSHGFHHLHLNLHGFHFTLSHHSQSVPCLSVLPINWWSVLPSTITVSQALPASYFFFKGMVIPWFD